MDAPSVPPLTIMGIRSAPGAEATRSARFVWCAGWGCEQGHWCERIHAVGQLLTSPEVLANTAPDVELIILTTVSGGYTGSGAAIHPLPMNAAAADVTNLFNQLLIETTCIEQ